jgi:hypothetical protein
LTRAGYLAVRLLQRFDKIEAASSEIPKYDVGITTKPKDGVKVRLHPSVD